MGKYIIFVDLDDWMEKDMLDKLYNHLILINSDISICNYYEVSNGKRSSKNLYIENIFSTRKFLYYTFDEKYFRGYLWNKLYSRDIIFKINNSIKFDRNIHMCEYLLFNYKVSLSTIRICYTDDKLYNYLKRDNSALLEGFSMKGASRLFIFKELIDIAYKYDINLVKQISFEYVRIAMEVKYKMNKINILDLELEKKLNKIRNKNIIMGLKYHEHNLLNKKTIDNLILVGNRIERNIHLQIGKYSEYSECFSTFGTKNY